MNNAAALSLLPPNLWLGAVGTFAAQGGSSASLVWGMLATATLAGFAGWVLARRTPAAGRSSLPVPLQAQSGVEERDNRFRILADNIAQLAWIADKSGAMIWYNQRWYDYTGTDPGSVMGWGWRQVHHPDHVDRVVEKITECFARGVPWEDTFPLRGRDGQFRWFLSLATPIRNDEGRVVLWIGTSTDITERREIEMALRESEERYRATFDNAAVGIAHIGPDGHWLRVNDRICQILGYPRQELLEKLYPDLVHPEDLVHDRETSRRLVAGETEHLLVENRYFRRDGGLVWVELTASVVRKSDGSLDYFIAVMVDATDRKRTEEALHLARVELEGYAQELEKRVAERTARLNEAVNDLEAFSYSIAHDMREPLRGIRGFAAILEIECGDQIGLEAKEYVRRIQGAAERMDGLITDVLNYSKIVRGGAALEPVDLNRLLPDILESYPALQPPHAFITVEGPLPPVIGNMAGLAQCFSNLLANAAKFVAPGVHPVIRIWPERRQGGRVRVFVKDNGLGIPAEAQERIFHIFQRLHSHEEFEGTGIGLAIVRKSVERMGGSVGVDSELGKGSTFWIELAAASPS